MDILVSVDSLVLAVVLPFVILIALCIVEVLVLWIVSWKLNIGLERIKIIKSRRKARAPPAGTRTHEELLEGHGNKEDPIYDSLRIPAIVIIPAIAHDQMPEYLTIVDDNEPVASIAMTTNNAYLQFHQKSSPAQ